MISVNPPSGFRDFIRDEARRRLSLMNQIAHVYQSFGFFPLETPVLENLEVLQGKGGGDENEKLIFKILKRGEKLQEALQAQSDSNLDESKIADFGLRFDLTLPLSRVVALYRGKIHFPWKVFHIGPVWRADRPQKGRFREFIQCDVDIIGAKGIGAEIEVIRAVVSAVHQVGAAGFELRLNDRRLIQALGEKFGFTGDKLNQFAILLDKKDKVELTEIIEGLKDLRGQDLPSDLLAMLQGKLDLKAMGEFHPEAEKDLKTIISTLEDLRLPLTQITFDPSLVRGMEYYTGTVFELRHSSAGYSFGGGGRYDKLIGRFCGQDIPACGFSIGFERLALLLAEQEKTAQKDPSTVFIPIFDESLRGKVLKFSEQIRDKGIEVDVYPDQAKIKNQFKFASDAGYRWVLVIGEQEWTSQIFKLKDFKTGVETPIPQDQVLSHLEKLL